MRLYTATSPDSVKTAYYIGHGFVVEITEDNTGREAWLLHNDCDVETLICRSEGYNQSRDGFLETVKDKVFGRIAEYEFRYLF